MSESHLPTDLPRQFPPAVPFSSPPIGGVGWAVSPSLLERQEEGMEPGVAHSEAAAEPQSPNPETAPVPASDGEVAPTVTPDPLPPAAQQNVEVNHGVVAASLTVVVAELLAHHELSDAYVKRCVATYAPGPLFDDALGYLRIRKIVVLVAEADTGRHEAAVNLLHRTGVQGLRELRHRAGATIDLAVLGTRQNTGWLLDLRDGRSLAPTFARELAGHDVRTRLVDTNSSFCLIVPPTVWAQAGTGAGDFTLAWQRTDAGTIVRKRLEVAGVASPDQWVEHDRIDAHLRAAEPAEAVQWAEKIKSVAALPTERLDFGLLPEADRSDIMRHRKGDHDLRAQMVVAAFSDWRDHLLAWHKQTHDARLLCFLVAAAVLEGRSVLEIHDQIESLHRALAGRKAQFKNIGLGGPGIIELVDIIGARTTNDLRVEFTRPGYGDAVLDYFWVDRQPMQQAFLHWMCALPETLDEDETAARATQRIGVYALRWTLRNGRFTFLQKIAESWGKDQRYRTTAIELITAAALNPAFGRTVRDKLLEWSKAEGEQSAELRAVVAEVCAGPLSRVYLTPALTRLGHLSKSDDPTVVEAVGNAMRTLWADETARAEVQKTLERWLRSTSAPRQNAVRHTFLALAGLIDDKLSRPVLMDLFETADGNGLLVAGWRVVLEDPTQRNRARDVLSLWLDAMLRANTLASAITAMLVDAATRHDDDFYNAQPSLAAIYAVHRWQDQSSVGDSETRRRVGDELVALIHSRDPIGKRSSAIQGNTARSLDAPAVA
ncbi:hypothetical protein [Micromonospora humida]|uniref:hypothetical protein n=1 Tax=Micromonospora humida TaxID=2809018 RepID=UPI00343003E7